MLRRSSGSSDGDDSPVETLDGQVADAGVADPRAQPSPTRQHHSQNSDPTTCADLRSSSARSRRSGNFNWKPASSRNGSLDKQPLIPAHATAAPVSLAVNARGGLADADEMEKSPESKPVARRPRSKSPWSLTFLVFLVSLLGIALLATILNSLVTRQLDPKGCRMSYMRPSYAKLSEFDTEHTRFASKYSLYLYREQGIDDDTKVRTRQTRSSCPSFSRDYCFVLL